MQHSEVPPIREIPVADKGAGPYGITAGPDGALWLTFAHSGQIARLTIDGELKEYPLDSPTCRPTVITPGPDGALWFTRSQDHQIGRITVDGGTEAFRVPTP
jgi:virginiamycin B lyase